MEAHYEECILRLRFVMRVKNWLLLQRSLSTIQALQDETCLPFNYFQGLNMSDGGCLGVSRDVERWKSTKAERCLV